MRCSTGRTITTLIRAINTVSTTSHHMAVNRLSLTSDSLCTQYKEVAGKSQRSRENARSKWQRNIYHGNLKQVATRTLVCERQDLFTPLHIFDVYFIVRHRGIAFAECSASRESQLRQPGCAACQACLVRNFLRVDQNANLCKRDSNNWPNFLPLLSKKS